MLHFVGFKDGTAYNSAVQVWGKPDFIHRGWDLRAKRQIADTDTVIFAAGPRTIETPASISSYNDIDPV